jgi:shikimate kinase
VTGPGEPGGPAAILIGPPGAGKSTVGPLLAARLGTGFTDTDDRVEAVAGKPVSEIFIDDGEQAFRALEREAVAWAVSGAGGELRGGVIGLGGGAILDPGTQQLLAGNPRTMLRALLEQRLPVYEKLASITVSTDDRAPEEVAADVAAQIAGPPR